MILDNIFTKEEVKASCPMDKLAALEAENRKLKRSLDILTRKYDTLLLASNCVLNASEMYDCFRSALDSAIKEIDIMVPWMSDYVLGKLVLFLRKTLEKDIIVKIRTGLNQNPLYQDSSYKAFDMLDSLKKDYPNLIFYPDITIGASCLLIVDDSFYIVGGYNFLGVDEESSPTEVGIKCEESTKLQLLRLRHFSFDDSLVFAGTGKG